MSQNAVHPTAANEARLNAMARQRNQQNAPALPLQASDTAEQKRFNGLLKQAEKLQNDRATAQKQETAQADAASAAEASAANAAPDETAATEGMPQPDVALLAALNANTVTTAATAATGTGAADGTTAEANEAGTELNAASSAEAAGAGADADADAGAGAGAGAMAPDAGSEALVAGAATLAEAAADAAAGPATETPAQEETALQDKNMAQASQQDQRLRGLERAREAIAGNPASNEPALERAAPLRDSTAAGSAAGATTNLGALGGMGINGTNAANVANGAPSSSAALASLLGAELSAGAGADVGTGTGAGNSGTSGEGAASGQNPQLGAQPNPGATGAPAARAAGGEAFAALLGGAQGGAAGGTPASAAQPNTPPAAAQMYQQMGQPLTDSFNQLGAQVSLWASQNLRRASLSLQGADGKPLDVDVSLKDGKTSLAFRTDDSATRTALQNFGQQALADMLQQHGLDLSALSVDTRGSQGAGQGQGQAEAPNATAAAARALRGLTGEGVASAAAGLGWTSKSAGSLDVYV